MIRPYKNINPTVGNNVYIDPQACVIGDVHLGNDVSVWPMAVIRGDVNIIKIGDACNIQDGAILHVTHDGPFTAGGQPLILGQGITVGHQAILHACTIGDFCLIGMGACILDKAHVEPRAMVGAGAVVSPGKRLKGGYLYLGAPAREVRALTTEELAHLEYSAAHYKKLKDTYLRADPTLA